MTASPSLSESQPKTTRGVSAWFRRLFNSADGIYSLILVAGVIIVSRNLTGSSYDALLAVVGTLFVFFAAHAYAATLAEMTHRGSTFRASLRHGVRESAGLLVIGLIPVAMLLLGVIGVLGSDGAVWLALFVDVSLLGLLGWTVTASRLTSVWGRLGGAVVTAAFGGIMIALKALIH